MLTTAFEQIYYVFLLDRHERRSGDGDDGPPPSRRRRQLARHLAQTQILPRCLRIHPRLASRYLLIPLCLHQRKWSPHLLVRDQSASARKVLNPDSIKLSLDREI
jgi:hypothetical protein